jgi:beta-glucosidase
MQPGAVVTMRAIDAGGVQEAGRQLEWSGTGQGTAALSGPKPVNLLRHTNADLLLEIEYRVDEKPTAPVRLAMTCANGCSGALDLTNVLERAVPGQWNTLKVRLVDFQRAGANMFEIIEPLVLTTAGRMRISLKTVRLGTDPAGVTPLPVAKR